MNNESLPLQPPASTGEDAIARHVHAIANDQESAVQDDVVWTMQQCGVQANDDHIDAEQPVDGPALRCAKNSGTGERQMEEEDELSDVHPEQPH